MKEGWITVNSVPTHVVTWGGWIEDKLEGDSVLLCITGNPGITDFYQTFLSTLQPLINMPVWIINFAGCEIPKNEDLSENVSTLPSLKRNNNLYDLSGQVKHKYDFIKTFIPKNKKIFMIGHSVGGKIVIELLKDEEISAQVQKTYLLFPTLEHIAESRNGKFVMRFLRHFIPLVIYLTCIFCLLPLPIRMLLFRLYFLLTRKANVDDCCLVGCCKLVQPKPLRGVFFLAMDEMYKIKELDHDVLKNFGHKVQCYYSPTDGWAPISHYENIKKHFPSVKASILNDHLHAFVLTTPKEIASKLSEEINEERTR